MVSLWKEHLKKRTGNIVEYSCLLANPEDAPEFFPKMDAYQAPAAPKPHEHSSPLFSQLPDRTVPSTDDLVRFGSSPSLNESSHAPLPSTSPSYLSQNRAGYTASSSKGDPFETNAESAYVDVPSDDQSHISMEVNTTGTGSVKGEDFDDPLYHSNSADQFESKVPLSEQGMMGEDFFVQAEEDTLDPDLGMSPRHQQPQPRQQQQAHHGNLLSLKGLNLEDRPSSDLLQDDYEDSVPHQQMEGEEEEEDDEDKLL